MQTWLNKLRARLSPSGGGPFVALDFDRRRLRVVCAEPNGDLPHFRKIAAVDIPGDVDIADPQALGRFIGQALRELGLGGIRIGMDVPRSRAVLKTVTLPASADEHELPGLVRYQVAKELPFAIDEAIIDFTIETHLDAGNGQAREAAADGTEAPGLTVLVAAVQRSVVDYYQQVADAAEAELGQLGLRPYADVHCLRACLRGRGVPLSSAVLIHLTADEAEIDVLIDGALAFSRSASMQVAHDEQGRPSADSPVPGLVVEVVRTLQSVRAAHRDARIEHLWVTGDMGIEPELAAALHQRLQSPCDVLRPADAMGIDGAAPREDGSITAIGLAIGHTRSGMPLDFLNPKRPPVQRDVRKIRMIAGASAAAAVLLLVIGGAWINLAVRQGQLQQLRDHYNQLDQEKRAADRLARRMRGVEEWIENDHRWLDHWANISAAFPPASAAYITSLKTGGDDSITLTVRARSSDVITDLGKRLRQAGYDVRLGSESTTNDDFGYRFTTTVRLGGIDAVDVDVPALKAPPRPADDGSATLTGARSRGGSS